MVEEHTKNKMLVIELMLAVVLLVFIGAFALDKVYPTNLVPAGSDTVPIVGFVPIEIKSQQIDLSAPVSTSFVMFSEKNMLFNLTSFRMSGEVTGEGRAEIVLDNGLGQELLIYSNIKQRQGNLITGMSVSDEGDPLPADAKISPVAPPQAWLKISAGEELGEMPKRELGDDKETVSGRFQHECRDTCYMNMKMKQGLYYTLKVRVDPGTEVKINELKYVLEV